MSRFAASGILKYDEALFPDFPLMMRLCETNYAQLRRLLPRKDEVGESQGYQVNGACYLIKIIESTRYTSMAGNYSDGASTGRLGLTFDERASVS
ncbi:hypothetical protein [Hafnia alvei]|uniref:hypothetical protein n=1 Tax=Hafnia alvei TaxID=569 RepID=UPI003558D5C5